MTNADMHQALTELAAAINRLRPDWRNAEEFYELRSVLAGRLRELANSPLATRTVEVVRTVRVEVPVPVSPSVTPSPSLSPPAALASPLLPPSPSLEGLPVALNADELAVLFSHSYDRQGGHQNRFRRWQKEIDRASGVLLLSANDVAWIWRQGSRPWKGSFQRRTRTVFWRALAELFASLGLAPSAVAILPTSKGRRAGPSREAPRRLRDPASPTAAGNS